MVSICCDSCTEGLQQLIFWLVRPYESLRHPQYDPTGAARALGASATARSDHIRPLLWRAPNRASFIPALRVRHSLGGSIAIPRFGGRLRLLSHWRTHRMARVEKI